MKSLKLGFDTYTVGDPKIFNSGEIYPIKGLSDEIVYVFADMLIYDYDIMEYVHVSKIDEIRSDCMIPASFISESGYTMKVFTYGLRYPILREKMTTTVRLSPLQYMKINVPSIEFVNYYLNEDYALTEIDGEYFIHSKGYMPLEYSVEKFHFTEDYYPYRYRLNDLRDYVFPLRTEEFERMTKINGVLPLLDRHTFGLEIETCSPLYFNVKKFMDAGIYALRDGSINGYEFTTIPLKGSVELLYSLSVFDEWVHSNEGVSLSDYNCSFQLNIGNIIDKFDSKRDAVVHIYSAFYKLQSQFLSHFAPYKREPSYFRARGSGTDHCRPLPEIYNDRSFNEKYHFIEQVYMVEDGTDMYDENTEKWNEQARYRALNLRPLLLGNDYMEIRLHSHTTNVSEMFMYCVFWSTFIEYVSQNKNIVIDQDRKLHLKTIMNNISVPAFKDWFINNYVHRNVSVNNHDIHHSQFFQSNIEKSYLKGSIAKSVKSFIHEFVKVLPERKHVPVSTEETPRTLAEDLDLPGAESELHRLTIRDSPGSPRFITGSQFPSEFYSRATESSGEGEGDSEL